LPPLSSPYFFELVDGMPGIFFGDFVWNA